MPRERGLEAGNRGGTKQSCCLVLVNCFPEAVAVYGEVVKERTWRGGVYRAGLQRIVFGRNRLAGVFGKAKVCQAKLTCMTQKSLPFASGFVLSNRDLGSIAHFEKRALPNGLWCWSDSFVD